MSFGINLTCQTKTKKKTQNSKKHYLISNFFFFVIVSFSNYSALSEENNDYFSEPYLRFCPRV